MRRILLKIARSPFGGVLAYTVIAKFPMLLSGLIQEKCKEYLRLSHPVSSYPQHQLVIPRIRCRDVFELSERPELWMTIASVIADKCAKEGFLCACNYGSRQDVSQVHFHLYKNDKFVMNEESPKLSRYEVDGGFTLTDGNGNFYIQADKVSHISLMKSVLALARKSCPEGFTIIIYP